MNAADEKKKRGSQGVASALTGITNLSVAGMSAVGAAAFHSWPILALGGVTYAALVAWDLARGGSGKARGRDTPEEPTLHEPNEYQDETVRAAVRTLMSARLEFERVVDGTPEDVKVHLALAIASVSDLLARAARLAERGEVISRYLAMKDPRVVNQDVEDLRRRAARATDPEVRAQYDVARASREEHLRLLGELGTTRERVVASLLSIASSLESLPAKVVRMRALDAEAMDKLTFDLNDELAGLNGEMKTLEDTLQSLGEVP